MLNGNDIRGGKSSIIGDRNVGPDDNKMISCIDAINLYGHSISQPLPFVEIKFERKVGLKDIINTPEGSDISCP